MTDQLPPVPPGPPSTPPPAGWYADPGVDGQLRFWDGRVWTDQVSVPQPAGPSSAGPSPAALPPVHVHRSTSATTFGCGAIAGIVLLALVLLFAVFIGVAKMFGGGGGGDGEYGEQTAITTCQFYVTARLQAPDTAVFDDLEASEGAENQWTVSGAVDSRSTGGTTERTTFVCSVSPGPDGGGLQLDRLRFDVPSGG